MTYNEFKKVKVGGYCVIIQTGELGKVLAVNSKTSDVQLQSKRAGIGMTTLWYNYTQLGKI